MSLTDSLKTDLAHEYRTPGGDIGRISGLPNLKRALFHRLMTVRGSLVHRPGYGVGVMQYSNGISSFSIQQKLAVEIQDQFQLDPRVESVKSVSITADDLIPQKTIIRVFVKPVGYSEQEMTYTPFSEAQG